ncbi:MULTISPECIES: GatB/YqeY domain-containing protein [Acidobacterium]|uniref:GatB/Yqey domain protein n=1 Tax=Acidobacterium capsulatum (strain ATCC 51196 / DSM 11244 / BCRC 80197 / JCM 7670 / NBRC 15755 / NCIMB 13165 / 161) TaxID=240015 RepID=C1F186_ACIC5|nr:MULTISPECIES: GatB/YqeY domain-containing protein [Acidobacterium]ACO31604.1 GatB/Yqey domain protein [Acidobacterium capsulatum ATCC 51196]HCT62418.1 GatB/YqeY domain-containing protein [Acidobacterium sp.]
MSLVKQIDTDTIAAMKAKDAERTGVLRMVKAAFKTREIEKREPLTDAEAQQVLTTMIKQRRESIEQFQKGGRADLAGKEAWEITVIEAYMPKAASEEEIRQLVEEAIAELAVSGDDLGPKDMGTAMKAVQARIQQKGLRADGRMVSEMVKARLAK